MSETASCRDTGQCGVAIGSRSTVKGGSSEDTELSRLVCVAFICWAITVRFGCRYKGFHIGAGVPCACILRFPSFLLLQTELPGERSLLKRKEYTLVAEDRDVCQFVQTLWGESSVARRRHWVRLELQQEARGWGRGGRMCHLVWGAKAKEKPSHVTVLPCKTPTHQSLGQRIM